jgi:hypothetical protein
MATRAEEMRAFLLAAQPAIVKLVDPDRAFAEWIVANCPNTLLVGRKYWGSNQPWGDPRRVAGGIMDMSAADVVKVWEGVNEPPRDRLAEVCRTDAEAARILHGNGFKYVAGSWSVGVPDIEDWLRPEMLAALREADYIGIHEYNAPALWYDAGIVWFLLRHRLWYPTLPADCQKPLLITETGIDSGAAHWDPGAQGGWQSFTHAPGYMEQLKWLDGELRSDGYVAGATPFQWGSLDPTWRTYDHTPELTALLRDYIISQHEPDPGEDWEQLYHESQAEVGRLSNLLADIEETAKER